MAAPAFDLEALVEKLLNIGQQGAALVANVSEAELAQLLSMARECFLQQPPLVEVEAPIRVCGDTHGQYADLMRIFNRGGFPPEVNYIFLGDYIDRGKQNIENIALLLAFKVLYRDNLFLLRGNHECAAINRVYGFYDECQRRYTVRLWQMFQDCFNCMPFCGLISNKILCMHGGLSPQLKQMQQLREIRRPVDPPNPSLVIDLLWSDPDKNLRGWQANTRGVSYVFGQDVLTNFCNALDIDLVARAHQVVQDGFEFFANRRLVTIFSAPHYCGEFDNHSGTMTVDQNLCCSFDVLKADVQPKVNKMK